MQNIRFRAWDKKAKKMFTVHEIKFKEKTGLAGDITLIRGYNSAGCTSFEGKDVFGGYNVQRFELMQFTGLKDKNGKEIYEGDIVTHNGVNNVAKEFTKGIIKYVDGAFCLNFPEFKNCHEIKYLMDSSCTIRELMFQARKIHTELQLEVIGNICESPELLTND